MLSKLHRSARARVRRSDRPVQNPGAARLPAPRPLSARGRHPGAQERLKKRKMRAPAPLMVLVVGPLIMPAAAGAARAAAGRGRGDGPHEADGEEVDRRQGAPQPAGGESRQEDEPGAGGGHQEAPPLPPRDRGAARDPEVPEEHRAADPQVAVPAAHPRDRAGCPDRPEVPIPGSTCAPRGSRGLSCRSLRRHEPLRHSREASNHHAERHSARAALARGARVRGQAASPQLPSSEGLQERPGRSRQPHLALLMQ
mmetsp:Transcript_67737/g.190942  ORF Transcript_67737/g.190942 Transcript_67737/m.190942 type:complete len:255 (+) Transcript_67737:74-838(+)